MPSVDFDLRMPYIMPFMPPAAGAAGSGAGMSVTAHSVVRINAAMDAAFCSAERVTFAGSMIPAETMSTHFMALASKPTPFFSFLQWSAMTAPSRPALAAICLMGSSRALLTML